MKIPSVRPFSPPNPCYEVYLPNKDSYRYRQKFPLKLQYSPRQPTWHPLLHLILEIVFVGLQYRPNALLPSGFE